MTEVTDTAVVIPCFNDGRTIVEALNSVRAQTAAVAECVIVDDGSDDLFTRRALEELRQEGTCVVRTPHRGVAAARSFGISLTSSPYIVLLDADDVLDAVYVERLARVLDDECDVDFVTCGLRAFGAADYVWTPPACRWVDVLVRGGPHIASMFRRDVWMAVSGFDSALDGYEDQDWWLRVLEHGSRGRVVPEPLLRYRVRPRSRYDLALLPDTFARTMATINGKHPGRTASDRLSVVVEKDVFRAELRAHAAALHERSRAYDVQIEALGAEIAGARTEVLSRADTTLAWGTVGTRRACAEGTPILAFFHRQFLSACAADIAGDVWLVPPASPDLPLGIMSPASMDSGPLEACAPESLDCVIMLHALNSGHDVGRSLAAAFRSLRPGGVLLCAAASMGALDETGVGASGRRFTPAAMRAVLAEHWPAELVEVTAYGNLQVCLAALSGVPAEALTPAVLRTVDEWHPLVACGRARKPASRIHAGQRGEPPSALILLYHRIGEFPTDTHQLQIGPEQFRRHLHHVKRTCTPLPLEQIVSGLRDGYLPPRAIAITFDDGYLQHLELVVPILRQLDLPATFFVTTEGLWQPYEHWWDVLERVFLGEHELPDVLDLYGDGRVAANTTGAAARAQVHRTLFEHLYGLTASARRQALVRLADWSGAELTPRASHRVLLAEELRVLASTPGISIGAHSIHHLALPMHAADVQWSEVGGSKTTLESVLARPIQGFSYPYGVRGRDAVDAVRSAGFRYGVTVEPRAVRCGANPLLLPRVEVKGRMAVEFDTRLAEAFAYSMPNR